ncbi:MAG: DUF4332 domain-containing protein [Thiolinea sp.]
MGVAISKLRGVDNVLESLRAEGIKDSEQFLELTCTPKGRKELAAKCGVETRVILELANRADLARLSGVSGVFGDLLEAAGVDTVKELATRRPDNLHAKIVEVNAEKSVAGRNPTAADVESWVAQAKDLPKMITY